MKTPLPRPLYLFVLGLFASSVLSAQTSGQSSSTPSTQAPAQKAPAAQGPRIDFPAPSPAATLKQRAGLTDIEITYSRPGAKGRQIFGQTGALVPYGEVWRTGANAATKVSFSTPVKFGGQQVGAGVYALFSVPGENEWTVILNSVTGQWGAYRYDSKNDIVRVTAAPVGLAEPVETFTIDVNDIRDDSATLNLIWANVKVPVKLEWDLVSTLVPQIDAAMASPTKPAPGVYANAAMFYLNHDLDLDKAAGWIDTAIERQPEAFYLYYHKARILAKQGNKAAAIETANRSKELAAKSSGAAKDEYIRLNNTLLESLE